MRILMPVTGVIGHSGGVTVGRYLDIGEHDDLDEAPLIAWIGQASELPGETI